METKGTPIVSKPPQSRRSSDPTHIALHYLCLTRLRHERPREAWRIVGEAWGLPKHVVQRLIADNNVLALAIMQRFSGDPDTLLGLCEKHALESRRQAQAAAV